MLVGYVWELHQESNEYRKKNMGKVIKKAVISKKAREKWCGGSGKVSFKKFRQMSLQIPSMMYPMFNFSYKLCVTSLGIPWWDSKKKYFKKQQQLAKDEFDAYEKKLENDKLAQFGSALSQAVLQDTVKALLAGEPLPPDASPDTIDEAKARAKRIQRAAAKMGVNASATGDKKKKPVSNQNTREVQDDDEDSGDEAEEIKREY